MTTGAQIDREIKRIGKHRSKVRENKRREERGWGRESGREIDW